MGVRDMDLLCRRETVWMLELCPSYVDDPMAPAIFDEPAAPSFSSQPIVEWDRWLACCRHLDGSVRRGQPWTIHG